jgi:anti-sigma-K factor RskA
VSDSHELDQLLGAYALDAVDADERRRVDEYLATNPRAAAEVAEHREVATMLAYSGMNAPEGLWDRIASSLDERAPAPGPELAKVMPMDAERRSRRPSRGVLTWVGATAAAALIAVVAVSVIESSTSPVDPLLSAAEEARDDNDSLTAQLVSADSGAIAEAIVDEQGHGFLFAGDLPPLPSDQTYQLWGVVGDQVISLGLLGPSPQLETFTARVDLAAMAITIEAAGGVISDGNPDGAFVGEFS